MNEVNQFSIAKKNIENLNKTHNYFKNIPNNSIIFCSLSDKYVYNFATTFTWWNGIEKYNSTQIGESIINLNNKGYTNIFIYKENEINGEEIHNYIINHSLKLQEFNDKLYKIIPNATLN